MASVIALSNLHDSMTLAAAQTGHLQIRHVTLGSEQCLPLSPNYCLQRPKRPVNDGGTFHPAYCNTTPIYFGFWDASPIYGLTFESVTLKGS